MARPMSSYWEQGSRHLGRAASGQARAVGRTGRSRQGGRGHVLRQYRHHRRQHHFSGGFPSDCGAVVVSRSSARRSPIIIWRSCRRSRRGLRLSAASRPSALFETAQMMRPLFARAVGEHEALAAEAGAERYLRHNGWLKLTAPTGFAAVRANARSRTNSASPMSRSIVTRRSRLSRRLRRCSATPCIGPAR